MLGKFCPFHCAGRCDLVLNEERTAFRLREAPRRDGNGSMSMSNLDVLDPRFLQSRVNDPIRR